MKNRLLASVFLLLIAIPACGSSDSKPGQTADSLDGDAPNACEEGFIDPAADGRVCNSTFEGKCFESDAAACACAGCPGDDCIVLESYPTQVRCATSGPSVPNPDEPSSDGPVSSDPAAPSGSNAGSPAGGGSPPSGGPIPGLPGAEGGSIPPYAGAGACAGASARDARGDGRACNATYAGQCFETSEAACACAGCAPARCLVMESFPAQVACE